MKKLFILLLIGIIFSTSGCYTIRKKFIRKKTAQQEEPVYVNFKDYPNKPSREAYVDYFIFVKGWLDDLSESLQIERLNRGYSNKRERRAINEAVMNLEQIIAFFNQEGKEKIYPLYKDLVKIRDKMEKDPGMSAIERSRILQKIEHFRREFEGEFNYRQAEKWME
ncbi:MAG: hypothetical protein WC412_02740 [Candidatus Omnitrophota bacterium]